MNKLEQTKVPVKCTLCSKTQQVSISNILNSKKVRCFSCHSEVQFGLKEIINLKKTIKDYETAEKKIESVKKEMEKALSNYNEGVKDLFANAIYQVKRK